MTTDDPCDDWPMWLIPGALTGALGSLFGIDLARPGSDVTAYAFADGGVFRGFTMPLRHTASIMGEAGPECVMPRRAFHTHQWSDWGPFREAPPPPFNIETTGTKPASMTDHVIAYRWRYCQNGYCTMREREAFGTHERQIFNEGKPV